ncbi:hypothetical protein AB1I77_28130 [Bacillus paranthracis]|uniref:hypothetical protein n=1 Tax=Bacillus TaxID=1386 RepID=UPI000B449B0B|nr:MULTISPECIES: hypothetical protein [Bacillus]MEC2867089.1 hypothetical protein [Bacillus cereus]MDA2593173.1 hypothetical protein [Bacillus cereus group sp. Bc065]MDY4268739.1 hypothetical protein [Bacillus paranthracis]MDY4274514.1 hypothetical protein [Bacillus paranthracis]MDY4290720.1 hypothetical protein [Bacillus paranthracis]
MDDLKLVTQYKASDGTEFDVSVDGNGLYYIGADFPYFTTSKDGKYTNNFANYVANDITDETTAKGIASFACFCYQRQLNHYEKINQTK